MKTKYIINKTEMIVSLDLSYELESKPVNLINIRKYINKIIQDNNINFIGNKIIVYKNGLLIGTFYLTNYYLNKIVNNKKNNLLTDKNSYFYETTYTEMLPKKKVKTKKLLSIN